MATTRPVLPVPLHEATLTLQQGIRAELQRAAAQPQPAPDTRNFRPQRPTHLTGRARHLPIAAAGKAGAAASLHACLSLLVLVFARNCMVLGLLRLSKPP
jgi:hypothetical protein